MDVAEFEPGGGFGRHDMAAFYAHNDSTSQHVDDDASWSIAMTYEKEYAPGLAGAFGWSEWGIVVQNDPNTTWFVSSL